VDTQDFPDFATEDGYRPPQKDFIDNIVYDGRAPNAYINKFAIGLKAGDKL
jgi:nitrate/nitrite transport system substrate-binding protein